MDNGFFPTAGNNGLDPWCFLIGALNAVAIIVAIFITIYSSIKQRPMKGLIIYWYATFLVLFISLCLKNVNGLYLYAIASPALVSLLFFHKWFNPNNLKSSR
jgi:hypothetical protein